MRILYEVIDPHTDVAMLMSRFQSLAASRGMDWKMRDTEERERVLLMVSKFAHCLGDLLYRVRIGELKMDIVAIVSTHPREALSIGMIDGIPYHSLPFPKTKDRKGVAKGKSVSVSVDLGGRRSMKTKK